MSEIVPFGKYRGQPVEVLQADQAYCDWLSSQDWFRERYSRVFNLIVNNSGEPAETPEHNKYQAMFLDKKFRSEIMYAACPDYPKDRIPDVAFEVRLREPDGHGYRIIGPADVQLGSGWMLRIEIKPSMGDDYPAVLRQMKLNRCTLLYLVNYTGTGATFDQMKQIFAVSDITVFMHSDFAHLVSA